MDELQQDEKADGRMAERLLRGGVGLRHVRRTLRELRDHRADLVSRLVAQGHDRESAIHEARIELGDREQLVQQMLSRPELRSVVRRFAWLVFAVGPLPMVAASVFLALLVAGLVLSGGGFGGDHSPLPAAAFTTVRLTLMWIAPLIVGLALCWAAVRHRVPAIWPCCAMALVALMSGATRFYVDVPPVGKQVTTLSIGAPPFEIERTLVLACVLALAYWLMRRKHSRAEGHA